MTFTRLCNGMATNSRVKATRQVLQSNYVSEDSVTPEEGRNELERLPEFDEKSSITSKKASDLAKFFNCLAKSAVLTRASVAEHNRASALLLQGYASSSLIQTTPHPTRVHDTQHISSNTYVRRPSIKEWQHPNRLLVSDRPSPLPGVAAKSSKSLSSISNVKRPSHSSAATMTTKVHVRTVSDSDIPACLQSSALMIGTSATSNDETDYIEPISIVDSPEVYTEPFHARQERRALLRGLLLLHNSDPQSVFCK
jgi:hypothetical protein